MNPLDLFDRPGLLPALLLGPLAWLGVRALDAARARRRDRWVGPRAHALAPGLAGVRRGLRRASFPGAVLLALLAMAGPVWGEGLRAVEPRGADVVVCLDVSRSMLARDEAPSRLGRAKREIAALAARAHGDRLALVVFAGEARLLVPLTRDRETFRALLETADPLAVARGGTDLGAALDAALRALEGGGGDAAAILLLTDGEDLEGSGLRAAARCRERGVPVHCVGLGTVRGSKIAVEGPGGEVFQRDRAGREVVSSLDPASLSALAGAAGGAFVVAGAAEHPLRDLHAARIAPAVRKVVEGEERRSRENRFQWPLFGALLLLVLELCLGVPWRE